MHDAGIAHYLPVNLGEIPDYYRRFIDPVDMLVIKCAPMDEDGYFNFGPANLWHGAVIERAKMVIVEECATMPHVLRAGDRGSPQRRRLYHRRGWRAAAGTAQGCR